MLPVRFLPALLCLGLILSACGNRGSLYLPDEEPLSPGNPATTGQVTITSPQDAGAEAAAGASEASEEEAMESTGESTGETAGESAEESAEKSTEEDPEADDEAQTPDADDGDTNSGTMP